MEWATSFIVTTSLAEVGMILDFKVVSISEWVKFSYIVRLHPLSIVGLASREIDDIRLLLKNSPEMFNSSHLTTTIF